MTRWLVLVALLGGPNAVTAQAPAAEGEEQARAHFRLGRAYYDNGAFGQAAEEFESAYRISRRPALLYNIYLAYRDASDLRRASAALRSYLELEKNVENRAQLSARLAAMERTLAASATAEPAKAASVVPPPAAPDTRVAQPAQVSEQPAPVASSPPEPANLAPLPAADESRHGGQTEPHATLTQGIKPWPIVLMALGGALVAGSLVTGVLALGKRSDLADAQQECRRLGSCNALSVSELNRLEDTRASGKTLAVVTDVLLFGGLATAAAGTVWLLLGRGHENDMSAATFGTTLSCYPGHCTGQMKLRF